MLGGGRVQFPSLQTQPKQPLFVKLQVLSQAFSFAVQDLLSCFVCR